MKNLDMYDKTKVVNLGCLLIGMFVSVATQDLSTIIAIGFYLTICELIHIRRDLS